MPRNTISRRRFLRTGSAAGIVGLASEAKTAAQATKVLRVRAYGNIEILDAGYYLGRPEDDIMRCLCGGLVTAKNGDEWAWEKQFAADIVQESPVRIRFQLKTGIPWSDGFGEVTAEDVKFSYERIANPAMKSPYLVDWEKLDRVDVTGTHAGVIVLKEPYMPLWESTLPTTSGIILCKKAVEKLDGQRFTTTVPAISGPYRIQKFEPQRSVILERNPLWTGPKPVFDEIRYITVLDANAAEVGHAAGEFDYTPQLPAASVPRLRKNPPSGSRLIVKPSLAFWWLGMQSEDGEFKDIRVRKAVQLAIDVDAVMEGAFFGAAERATGIVALSLIGHRPKNLIEKPDREQARKLLAEAGYPNGFKTDIGVRNSAEFINAAQIVAANLAQIGITAEVIPYSGGVQKAMAGDKNGGWKKMHMHIVRFSMEPDPAWATAWFVSGQIGEWNWERFSNKEFDELQVKAMSEPDTTKRGAMYQRMQDLMEESGSYIFLTHGVNAALCRNTIKPAITPDGSRLDFANFGVA